MLDIVDEKTLWMISSKESCFLLAGGVLAIQLDPIQAWFEALRLIYFSFTLPLRVWSLPVGYGSYGFLTESQCCYSRFLDLLAA